MSCWSLLLPGEVSVNQFFVVSHLLFLSSPADRHGFLYPPDHSYCSLGTEIHLFLPLPLSASSRTYCPGPEHLGKTFNFYFCVFCIVGFWFLIFSVTKATYVCYREVGRYESNEKKSFITPALETVTDGILVSSAFRGLSLSGSSQHEDPPWESLGPLSH